MLPVVGKEKYSNVTAELMLLNYKYLSETKIRKGNHSIRFVNANKTNLISGS